MGISDFRPKAAPALSLSKGPLHSNPVEFDLDRLRRDRDGIHRRGAGDHATDLPPGSRHQIAVRPQVLDFLSERSTIRIAETLLHASNFIVCKRREM